MKRLNTIIISIFMIVYMLFPTQAMCKEIGIGNLPPKLIIESYELDPKQLIPGEEFCIKLNIKNTNPEVAAENIILTYTSSDNSIYPVYGTPNQSYISSIVGEETKQVWLYMKVSSTVKSEVTALNFTLDYSSAVSSNVSCNANVILPISSNCKMAVNSISVAEDSNVGSKSLVNVKFTNTGIVNIKNITMKLQGDILEEQKQIVFGDLGIGGQAIKDYYVNFQNEGKQQLKISFTYEDEDGTVFEIPESMYTTIVGPAIKKDLSDEKSTDKALDNKDTSGLNIWQYVFLVVSIVVAILVVVKVYKKGKKKTKI